MLLAVRRPAVLCLSTDPRASSDLPQGTTPSRCGRPAAADDRRAAGEALRTQDGGAVRPIVVVVLFCGGGGPRGRLPRDMSVPGEHRRLLEEGPGRGAADCARVDDAPVSVFCLFVYPRHLFVCVGVWGVAGADGDLSWEIQGAVCENKRGIVWFRSSRCNTPHVLIISVRYTKMF